MSTQGNYLGVHSEAGLQVLMDIGLADATGMSVDQLKRRLQSVEDLQNEVNELNLTVESLRERYRERDNSGETVEPDEEEPGIALEDQLRITEQSAKAIDLFSSHLLATVWQTCSKNTFGFYIRIMLLSGSQFKKQLIPETASLIILGLLTVLFSAAMQIILAYYLWTRLPKTYPEVNGDNVVRQDYAGTNDGRSYFNWNSPPLPAYPYPNYKFANDVCRTVPIVQLVTIGLFLFSILNNIPGVIKNFHIIWNSDRFISVDEEGITKLHHWRESHYSRESAENFLDFLNKMFHGYLSQSYKKIEPVLSNIHQSMESETAVPWEDSELSELGRLKVKEQILQPSGAPPSDAANAGTAGSSTSAASADILGIDKDNRYDVEAFICEMYLSGSIVQDVHSQKIIQEYQKLENQKPSHSGGKYQAEENCTTNEQKETFNEYNVYSGASRRRWMLNKCFTDILPKKWWQRWNLNLSSLTSLRCCSADIPIPIPKSFFEVCETRSFLAEALRLMDRSNNTKKAGMTKDLATEKQPLLFSILRDNTAVWPPPIDLPLWQQPIQFCDQVRLNLVRIDYLRPSRWTRPYAWRWLNEYEGVEDDRERVRLTQALLDLRNEKTNLLKEQSTIFARIKKMEAKKDVQKQSEDMVKKVFEKLEGRRKEKEVGLMKAVHSLISDKKMRESRENATCGFSLRKCLTCFCYGSYCCPTVSKSTGPGTQSLLKSLHKYLGRDFADVLTSVSFSHFYPSRMIPFRVLAFTFGVLPELISLLFMVVAGVQYILWSGFKVGSDTQGMEEIILATLAINFIYEIDDAVYDHVLPELYKEAHERDRFDITGYWISSETTAILDKCAGTASSWWWHKIRKLFCCHTKQTVDEQDCLKMLSRCQPIASQNPDSLNPLERGFLKKAKEAEEKAKGAVKRVNKEAEEITNEEAEGKANKKAEEKAIVSKEEVGEKEVTRNSPQCLASIVFSQSVAGEGTGSSEDMHGLQPRPDLTFYVGNKEVEKAKKEVEEKARQEAGGGVKREMKEKASKDTEENSKEEGDNAKLHRLKVLLAQKSENRASDAELKELEEVEQYVNEIITEGAKKSISEETDKYKVWKKNFDKAIEENVEMLSNDWTDWDAKKPESKVGGSPFIRAMKMSVSDEWNDVYLAHAYPFLYARKLRYAFANHWWERFLVFYGMWGMHLVVLVAITLAIVGGYRKVAQCDRFAPKDAGWLGVFAKQDWPSTCLLNVGKHQHESFASLENATADDFLAVSCGVNGYIPSFDEWERNRDYFTAPPED